MKAKLHSSHVIRPLILVLLGALTLTTSTRCAPAQDRVTISAAEFQRLVYSAHLHTRLALKPELEAGLQVLLELQRRNPQVEPAALAGALSNGLQRFRASAPYYLRTNGCPDEVLAAYLDALRQVPQPANLTPVNLIFLNKMLLGSADLNYYSNVTVVDLINSTDGRLSSTREDAIHRQALVDDCVGRSQGNAAFATALNLFLYPETRVSLGDLPGTIIGSTNSPLHDSATMLKLLTLQNPDGSITISNASIIECFNTEMQTFWDISRTNMEMLAQIKHNWPDLPGYLTNQAAIDANLQFHTAVLQVQPPRLASAAAAVLVQSKLLSVNTNSALIENAVSAGWRLGLGIGSVCCGQTDGLESLMSGGLDMFNMFTGYQSPQDATAVQIGNIQTLIGDLSTNMNYRFDRVDQSLSTIFETMNSSFSNVFVGFDHQGRQIATLQGSVKEIRKSLANEQATLNRLETEIWEGFTDQQHKDVLNCIDNDLLYEFQFPNAPPVGATAYHDAEKIFHPYATGWAEDNTVSPRFPANNLPAPETQLADLHFERDLNYIKEFLNKLGQSTAEDEPLANPREWFVPAYGYLQLALENPTWFRVYSSPFRIDGIIGRGEKLTNFCRSLTFSGTNINWPLFAKVENYYNTNLPQFKFLVSTTEGQWATDAHFALDTWRQWDSAAPRITASVTKVSGAGELPASLPREFATNIAAGARHSLALKADGSVVGWGNNSAGQISIPAGLLNVVAIAAGDSNGLALRASGTVVGWGDNSQGQTNIPSGLNNVKAIAAGGRHCLALRTNGTVVGWGNNSYSQTNVPAGLGSVTAIAAGANHSLALKADGTVVAWGDNSGIQTNVPAGLTNVVAIAAGALHNLALKADGTLVGWGFNYYGEATGVPRPVPPFTSSGVVMAGGQVLSNVVAIAAGESFSLARLRDGTVYGWGQNYDGEATGVPSHQIPPMGADTVKVAGQMLSNVVAIAAAGRHSLALKSDRTIAAWGELCLVPPALTWRGAVSASYRHALALKADGTVVGSGFNDNGQSSVPASLSNVVATAAGNYHSLALKADGTAVGWGHNEYGQATVSTDLSNLVAIAAGSDFSLVLKADGTVVGWGDNGFGKATVPANLDTVVAISAVSDFSLALKSDGTVVGWGNSSYGQTNVPPSLTNVVAIAAGWDYGLALKSDGTVVGWGYNYYGGATGTPSTTYPYTSPGAVVTVAGQPLTNVVAITAGAGHSLALKADRTAVGWGRNDSRQATIPAGFTNVAAVAAGGSQTIAVQADGTLLSWGDNVYIRSSMPAGLSNVVAIADGSFHRLALKADGTVVAWGSGGPGTSGQPNYGQTIVPASLTNVISIAAGSEHSLALKADGTVTAWGRSIYGETNIPAGLTNVVAIAAGVDHDLALKHDGTVVGWGNNYSGQTNTAGLNNVVAIAAGYGFSLALKADGTVAAWGVNSSGQTNVPPGLNGVVAIAAGYIHGLALKANGTLVGWGGNYPAQTNFPPDLTNVVAIAAGNQFNLALKADGTVVARGLNNYGQTNFPPGLTNVVAIAAGLYHSLVLTGVEAEFSAHGGGLPFVRAGLPRRVTTLFQSCNQNTIEELSLNSGRQLSGAKLLLQAVLELGMPYTLGRDEILHGSLYGSDSILDTDAAIYFLQNQNLQLEASPHAPLQTLAQVASPRFDCFTNRLYQCLTNLQAMGQPEIPRLVAHTVRMLYLLKDAWTDPANSPPPVLEMSRTNGLPSVRLYGEPYNRYTLQYCETLTPPGWTNTTVTKPEWTNTAITNLRDDKPLSPPDYGHRLRFYRAMLPTP